MPALSPAESPFIPLKIRQQGTIFIKGLIENLWYYKKNMLCPRKKSLQLWAGSIILYYYYFTHGPFLLYKRFTIEQPFFNKKCYNNLKNLKSVIKIVKYTSLNHPWCRIHSLSFEDCSKHHIYIYKRLYTRETLRGVRISRLAENTGRDD